MTKPLERRKLFLEWLSTFNFRLLVIYCSPYIHCTLKTIRIPYHSILPTLILTSLISIGLFHFMAYQTDTSSYVTAVKILLGESAADDRLFRLSKPLTLLLPALLHRLLGISIEYGFFFQQLLAYLGSALILYQILFHLLNNRQAAYNGMLAYLLCQPIPVYGLAMLTDGLGWFWAILGIVLVLRFIDKPTYKINELCLLGIFLGLGFFIKESIIATGIFLFYYILLHQSYTWKQKIIAYSLIGSTFLGTLILGNLATYFLFHESIYQWMVFGHNDPPNFNLKGFITQAYRTLDVYWLLVAIGLLLYSQQKQQQRVTQAMLLAALSCWILLPLTWPYLYDRILFLNAPFLMFWVALGASYFGSRATVLIILGGSMNLLATYGIYKHQITGLIALTNLVFLGLLLITYWYKKS